MKFPDWFYIVMPFLLLFAGCCAGASIEKSVEKDRQEKKAIEKEADDWKKSVIAQLEKLDRRINQEGLERWAQRKELEAIIENKFADIQGKPRMPRPQ
jgi:hypothetical protein